MHIRVNIGDQGWGFQGLFELTVTGESTLWTFDSSTRISLALEHRALTSDSLMISQRRNCSIWRSRSLIFRRFLSKKNQKWPKFWTIFRKWVKKISTTVMPMREGMPDEKQIIDQKQFWGIFIPSKHELKHFEEKNRSYIWVFSNMTLTC